MSKWRFTPPGRLQDFKDPQHWHEAMAEEAKAIVDILVQAVLRRPPIDQAEHDRIASTLAYVDPTYSLPPANSATVPLTPWGAFPRAVKVKAPWKDLPPDDGDPDGSYRAAEQVGDDDFRPGGVFIDRFDNVMNLPVRHRQDEYLEWVVRRDDLNRITKAVFVAEGYDYFAKLYDHDEARVVEIYREFTETAVVGADDLRAPNGIYRRDAFGRTTEIVRPGTFNPRNRYNLAPGIVHLSHRANSLGAEVNLAGVSGIARSVAGGELLDGLDERRLLCCAEGGDPNRNSDPLIAKQAYTQVLKGNHYTLADPVGLYIAGIDYDRLQLPQDQGAAPAEWWRAVRGDSDSGRMLRLELEVPRDQDFVLGDLLVDGLPLKFGGQLAELLTVHLFVTVWPRLAGGNAGAIGYGPTVPCDATCCVKIGTDALVISDGACSSGFTLKYPGLLEPAGPQSLLLSATSTVQITSMHRALRAISATRYSRLP